MCSARDVSDSAKICGSCGGGNDPTRRFCARCGAQLRTACDCGFANDEIARFCGGCGKELNTTVAAPSPGERRQVSVLFADLVGYTNLSARHDPERVRDLLEEFFETVDGLTVAFGGSVNQHLGDGVLALFGAPISYGDDAARAVAAALAIHEAVARLLSPDGTPLAVHIGIASGVVVAATTGSSAHRTYTVTGSSVNLSSRLMELGGAGETLISEPVYRSVGVRLRSSPRGEVAINGLPEPVRVWSVDGLDHSAPPGSARPFVGRESEKAQFTGVLAALLEKRTGAVLHIRGEPGIGKSRFAHELITHATGAGCVCALAYVLDFGAGLGSDAVRQLARSLLGLGPSCQEAQRREAAGHVIASGRVAEGHAGLLSELLDVSLSAEQRRELAAMDDTTRRTRRKRVLTALVEAACADSPLLIVVEDVHWADQASLDAIAAVATLTTELPVLLLLTSRIDGDPIHREWHARLHPSALVTLQLDPLLPADALKLTAAMGVAGDSAAGYVERAAGNPLFLEHLVHHAEDRAAEAVPPSIQSLVLARLDQLTRDDRMALQAASVLGQRFSLPALRHVLEKSAYGCERLLARHLVRPDDNGLIFDHALIRDAVYESLLRPRRQDLHRRAAAWFRESDVVLHAQHLDRADDPAAARALLLASRAQFAAYRTELALLLVERALVHAAETTDRAEIACLHGEILQELGRIDEAITAYETVLDATVDEVWRCRVRIGLASAMRLADRLEDAYEQLDLAQRAAEKHALVAELSRLHFLRGSLHFPLCRVDLCRSEHDAALGAAQASGRPELVVNALGGVADAAFAQGHFHTALDCYCRCVELAREHGLGRVEVANLVMIQTCHQMMGIPGGLAEAEVALAAAARVGHRRAEILALHGMAYGLLWAQRGDYGRSYAQRAVEICDRFSLSRFRAQSLAYMAHAEHVAGDFTESVRLFEIAMADASVHSTQYFHLSIIGHYLQVVREPQRRRELLAEGDRIANGPTLAHDRMHFFCGAMEATLRAGEWARAEEYADQLERTFIVEPIARVDAYVRRGRALAAWGNGPRTAALRHELEEVLAAVERMDIGLHAPAIQRALAGFPA